MRGVEAMVVRDDLRLVTLVVVSGVARTISVTELLVAELDEEVVGCLQLTLSAGLRRRGATRAQVEGVRVAAQQRSRGIDATLMRLAMERARAPGATFMQLTSDASRSRACQFSEGLGVVASHVGMKRSLVDP